MHELSISESIVRTALETPGASRANLRALTVKVGALSSVSTANLAYCMDLVLEQKGMRSVEVRIEEVPALARCRCGHEYTAESIFLGCPRCGGFDREITGGRDVSLESIEVEDD
jgi:hydrogenase nickel incorporation protein HypA/HybF